MVAVAALPGLATAAPLPPASAGGQATADDAIEEHRPYGVGGGRKVG